MDWTLNCAAACWDATCDNSGRQYPLLLTATARREDVGIKAGDDVMLYYIADPHTDRTPGGIEAWRKIGAEYRQHIVENEMERRRVARAEAPAGVPIGVERHVQAIGAVLAAEPAADAIGTLFNRYAELPGAEDRAAFALALVAEVVMGRTAGHGS